MKQLVTTVQRELYFSIKSSSSVWVNVDLCIKVHIWDLF